MKDAQLKKFIGRAAMQGASLSVSWCKDDGFEVCYEPNMYYAEELDALVRLGFGAGLELKMLPSDKDDHVMIYWS